MGRWGKTADRYCLVAVAGEIPDRTDTAGFLTAVGAAFPFTTPAANAGFGVTRIAVMACDGADCSAFSFQALTHSAP